MTEVNASADEPAAPDAADARILDALRSASGPVSGQALAAGIGMSRVALWKRIERLRSCGYRIEAAARGYRLAADDALAAWEFGGAPVRYRAETGSTMDEAAAWAEAGAPSGALVVAGRQSGGRGQHGRAWHSPDGGLYCTVVLRPELPASHAGALSLEAAAFVAGWLAAATGQAFHLRWPNDLFWQDRKVGGVLVELAGPPERPRWYTLGLGVNFARPGEVGRPAAGLCELPARVPRRRELAEALRAHLAAWALSPALSPERWAELMPGLGRPARLEELPPPLGPGGTAELCPQGLSRRGGLLLSDRRELLPGDIVRIDWDAPA